jgi:hypothetical protein
MTVLGSLSSVNLIAAAGILGNIGGIALGTSTELISNISTYTSTSPVINFTSSSGGYVSVNVVANTFPALTNAIPTAYQGNLGSGTLTAAITSQTNQIMCNGNLGEFEQVFNSAQAFVSSTNTLIKTAVNANDPNVIVAFGNQDNVITGSLSKLTLAFSAFSDDLAQSGNTIDFVNLNNLGSPAALLKQIGSSSYTNPGLNTALLSAGLPSGKVTDIEGSDFTNVEQKLIYQAMTQVTGTDLSTVLTQLGVTTAGIVTLADLLNPVKLFPRSFNTLTTPTANGLRGIYINSTGNVNSLLETELPESVMNPLQDNDSQSISYITLQQVIPPDQALANKALTNALSQVKTIFDTTGSILAAATQTLETNKGLNLINALIKPLPDNVYDYFTQTLTTGTGPFGTYLLTDIIGTPTGWITNDELSNTVTIFNSMTNANAFVELTNSVDGVYTVMANTASGIYTTLTGTIPNPNPPPDDLNQYTTTIPGGLPGAGSYVADSESGSIQLAFNNGLIPAMLSEVNTIIANYPAQVTQLNSNWANISVQLINVDQNLVLAGVDFANLQPNLQPTGLAFGLSDYGLDTVEGGAAFVMESLAQLNTIGGQAIVSTMREARNQVKLAGAGIETDITVSEVIAEPQATLSSGQYTVSEAAGQKII